jgi:uncharacterized protein (DUF58 family)
LGERTREVQNQALWQNFAASLGLLTIAMLVALYSSSAARDGRRLPGGISAIVALGIAIWVGVRFVPRLAANVDWDWLPFLSQYHVTREGWIYFGSVFVVVFAAINTNNNLLYMVLSALMAVLLLSGILAAVNFRWLKFDLRMPKHCFAGEVFPISLQIHNRKTIFPSFSLTVDNIDGAGFVFRSFYLECLRAHTQSVHVAEAMLRSRGSYQIRRVKVLSRYPFGFFRKGREFSVAADCICYPAIIPLEQLNRAAVDLLGSSERFERGLGNDLYMIRNYLPSDSARYVHWKASAKTAALKTREFAAEESHKITMHFDRSGQIGEAQRFEHLVSYAASLVVYLVRQGIEIALVSDEWTSAYGSSQSHIETILGYLALVQLSTSLHSPVIDNGNGAILLSLRHESLIHHDA